MRPFTPRPAMGPSPGSPTPDVLLLVVGPDAEAIVARLAVDATPAPSHLAAEAYLSGAAFDAVAVPDGADDLAALAGRLGTRVVRYSDADDLVARFAQTVAPAAEPAAGADRPAVDPDDARAVLTEVRDRLAHLAHALNNPMAVIAGNAQLGQEVARATGADPEVLAALDDVAAGADALAALLDDLTALRRSLDAHLG